MYQPLLNVAVSTPSMVLRYAAAIFFIAVAVGLVYALVRLGKTLKQAELLLGDVNNEVVPLLKQATETLDNVNEELVKLDTVMGTVVDVTEKVDATTRAMEAAVSMPAKKAAAFGAGVSQAFSSMLGRRDHTESSSAAWSDEGAAWRRDAADAADQGEPGGSAPVWEPATPAETAEAAPGPVAAEPPVEPGSGEPTAEGPGGAVGA